jgi:hypothetical protein
MLTLIIYKEKNKSFYEEYCDSHKDEQFLGIHIDENIFLTDWGPKLPIKKYEDFISEEKLYEIDVLATHYAEKWYKNPNVKNGITNGIPWGQLIEYECRGYLTLVFKQIILLECVNPEKVVLVHEDDLVSEAIKSFCISNKIDLVLYESNGNDKIAPKRKNPDFKQLQPLKVLSTIISAVSNRIVIERIKRKKNGKGSVYILPYVHSRKILSDFEKNPYWNLIRPIESIKSTLKNFGKVFFVNIQNSLNTNSNDELIKTLIDMRELNDLSFKNVDVWGIIKNEVVSYLAKIFPEIYQTKKWFTKNYKKLHIKAVIVNQDWTGFEKFLIQLCLQYNLTGVVMSHGMNLNLSYFTLPVSKHLLVWDRISEKYFTDILKIDKEYVTLVESSYLQSIPESAKKYNREYTIQKLKMESGKKVVLFIAPVFVNLLAIASPYEANMILKEFCTEMSRLEQFQCIIRFHPSTRFYEDLSVKKKVFNDYKGENCFFDPGLELLESVNAADLVVGFESTVFIEAIFSGKPIIVFNTTGKKISYQFKEENACWYVKEKSELVKTIMHALNCKNERDLMDKNIKKFIENKCCIKNSNVEDYTTLIESFIKKDDGSDK